MKLIMLFVIVFVTSNSLAQVFHGLGTLSGNSSSIAADLSGDGNTVVGRTANPGDPGTLRSWKWAQPSGMIGLPLVPGFTVQDQADRVSTNGSVIVGTAGSSLSLSAFISQDGVSQPIPGMLVGRGVSGNGLTTVGYTEQGSSDIVARRWSLATGTQGFGPLSGTPLGLGTTASANAASTNGSIITGYARVTISVTPPVPQVISTPFIWDAVNGARTMPLADGSLLRGLATDITPTGSVIVGVDISQPVTRLFRWSQDAGYQFISVGSDINDSDRIPRTSADGNAIIAGLNYWSPSTGVITVQQLLTSAGCDFTGWTLSGAVGISDDGRTIAGNGTSPTGQTQAWIATVPAPAAAPFLVLAAFARTRCRRT